MQNLIIQLYYGDKSLLCFLGYSPDFFCFWYEFGLFSLTEPCGGNHLSVVNQMLLKHRAKLEAAQQAMEDAKARMETEKASARETKAQIDELLSWAECFDAADIGTRHMIISRLISRVEVTSGYKIHIDFRISIEQFLGQAS